MHAGQIKLIIADDESAIRSGLAEIINREFRDQIRVTTAENGRQAIDFIRRYEPDIALIDINMPDTDGLAVIRESQESGSQARFFIISGYNDFQYAQSAIRYGVKSYFLKPLNISELKETLLKHCEEIRNQQGLPADLSKQNLSSLMASSRLLFLIQLIEKGLHSLSDIRDKLALLKLRIRNAESIVIVFVLEGNTKIAQPLLSHVNATFIQPAFSDQSIESWVYNENQIVLILNRAAIEPEPAADTLPKDRTMLSRGETTFAPGETTFAPGETTFAPGETTFAPGETTFAPGETTFAPGETTSATHETAFTPGRILKDLTDQLNTLGLGAFYVGIGNVATDLRYCHQSYTQAHEALLYRIYDNEVNIFDSRVLGSGRPSMCTEDIDIKPLVSSILYHRRNEIITYCKRFFYSLFYTEMPPPNYIAGMCMYLILNVQKKVIELYPEQEIEFDISIKEIISMGSIKRFEQWLIDFFLNYSDLIQQSSNEENCLIRQVKDYVNQQLHLNIKMYDVAKYVNLSESYFSVYFREKTGQSFRDYILHEKMKKAKGMLIQNHYSIQEISEAIGYRDYRSFSRAFRNIYSLSPSEYQKKPIHNR